MKHYLKNEIKAAPKEAAKSEVPDAALSMAQTLIVAMNKLFTPDAFHDEYQARLREIIKNKIAGKEIVAAPDEHPNNVSMLIGAEEEPNYVGYV